MKNLALFILLTVIGFGLGSIIGINPIEIDNFNILASLALAFGLYTAVSGIDINSLGKYKKISVFIVTAGVPIQILVTAAIMYIIYPHPISILVAVAIDQIDPISVSTLLNNKLGMTKAAKSLLNVWASFDDPVTVLFGFALLLPLVTDTSFASIKDLGLGLILNIVPAVTVYYLAKSKVLKKKPVQIITLLLSIIFTVATQSFLFIALVGLLVRPFDAKNLGKYTTAIYYAILLIVGMSLPFYGIDLRLGFLLALVEFFVVQPLSAITMVKGTANDIFRLAFAQQNGLTTLLMGLTFQALGFNVLPILLPAIICINAFNLTINWIYSYKEQNHLIITKVDKKTQEKFKHKLSFD